MKKKRELNYKRGTTAHDCSECNYYVAEFEVRGIGGKVLGTEPRCMVIGLKDGRVYRINPKNICDEFDNSEFLRRLTSNDQ